MGIMDFIRGQLIEILEWNDDTRNTLSWRFPDNDNEIKRGAQLIVRESQIAQFVYLGQFGDQYLPGKYSLTTDNIPVITTLEGWKYGFQSPFKADMYFVSTKLFTGNKWGTANPIMVRDKDFGIVRVQGYGTYDFKVVDPKLFLKEIAGTDANFTLEEFGETMRSRLVSIFSESVAKANVPVLDIATRYSELGEALLPVINPLVTGKYGIEFKTFVIENVSVPKEVEEAIDKRSSMAAVGNLNDYVKFQMGQGIAKGGSGLASAGAEMAMGMQMAGQFMQQGQGQQQAPAASAPIDVMNPAQVAQALGVTEQDVLMTLESGDLKGKKIGNSWRVTRQALDEFLKN